MIPRRYVWLLGLALGAGCAPADGDGDEASPLDSLVEVGPVVDAEQDEGEPDAIAAEPDMLAADMSVALDASPDAAVEQNLCVAGDALLGQVDRERMFADLQALVGLGERSSWENQGLAADYIVGQLETLDGVEVVRHEYTWAGQSWVNVEATIPGAQDPEHFVLAGAHYDSTSGEPGRSPGADDDASGCATLLEAARVLSTCPPAQSVRLLFFSNEEEGTIGSMAYAGDLTAVLPPDRVDGYINLDMLAFGPEDEDLDIATRPSDEDFAEAVAQAVEEWTELDVVRHIDEHCG